MAITRSLQSAVLDGAGINFRNRIINGDMRIDQRNAGAATANTYGGYTLDRWAAYQSTSGKITVQQNAGSATLPAGFTNYLGVTSQSSYSILSSDAYILYQWIEGFNTSDLAWGTSNAKPVTISFWVYSSLTGSFSIALTNNVDQTYVANYTIGSANTWTYVTITIPGSTTGTWQKTTSGSMALCFNMGTGSSYLITPNSWQNNAGARGSTTGNVSVVGTSGATLYVTGVQLEVGSSATPFERIPYGTELALCQRYCYQIGWSTSSAVQQIGGIGQAIAATSWNGINIPFPVSMRSQPTMTYSNLSHFVQQPAGGGSYAVTSISQTYASLNSSSLTTVASGAGATIGQASMFYANNSAFYMNFSAEL